jgi:hypothetical protein
VDGFPHRISSLEKMSDLVKNLIHMQTNKDKKSKHKLGKMLEKTKRLPGKNRFNQKKKKKQYSNLQLKYRKANIIF